MKLKLRTIQLKVRGAVAEGLGVPSTTKPGKLPRGGVKFNSCIRCGAKPYNRYRIVLEQYVPKQMKPGQKVHNLCWGGNCSYYFFKTNTDHNKVGKVTKRSKLICNVCKRKGLNKSSVGGIYLKGNYSTYSMCFECVKDSIIESVGMNVSKKMP